MQASPPKPASARPAVEGPFGPDLQLWGGHECTVNRVRDRYLDQTVKSGHEHRIEDLARFAELGLKALRYPVLWERIAPSRPDERDWRWSDERLAEIRRLGMRPIAGLCHHGSGPRYTHLLDDGFAPGLAAHARAVAERYPWLDAYTPVNEPLTTARFSGLYGHWYPHARDEGAFLTILLNEVDATRLAMREIRQVNPAAKLIQTEDLGYTFATPPCAGQAEFENQRRWLCWDLLTGRVGPDHPFFDRIARHGLRDRLLALLDDPCPPDLIGVNHYLTSERFLDHRVDRYPLHRRGGNGRMTYADVEAVRAVHPGPLGLERLLEQAWERYGLPVAVTECHNGCTREEQMRWAYEAWVAAEHLRSRGVPVQAVTMWALLGSHDWNKLLTVDAGHYEVGVFDVRSGEPRPTGMVELCKQLSSGKPVDLPAVAAPGWWSRDIRYEFAPVTLHDAGPRRRWVPQSAPTGAPLLITGATGTLGRALAKACEHRGLAYLLTCRNQMCIESEDSVRTMLEEARPWAVINAAGWVRVDDAEAAADACHAANAAGVANLARACAERGLPFVGFSSDLVFDGAKGAPYTEDDAPNPLNVYGASKAAAEAAVAEAGGRGLMVRTAAFFCSQDPYNFARHVVAALSEGRPFRAPGDCVVSPTYTQDLVQAVLDLLIDGETGVRHLANGGEASWADFGREIARAVGLDEQLVEAAPVASFGWAARRPLHVPLATARGQVMPSLEDAIHRFAQAMGPAAPARAERRRSRTGLLDDIRSFAPAAEA